MTIMSSLVYYRANVIAFCCYLEIVILRNRNENLLEQAVMSVICLVVYIITKVDAPC